MADTPNTAEPGKPRRRWFQFRLRMLLIAVVLIGAACAYVAHEAKFVAARKAWLAGAHGDERLSTLWSDNCQQKQGILDTRERVRFTGR